MFAETCQVYTRQKCKLLYTPLDAQPSIMLSLPMARGETRTLLKETQRVYDIIKKRIFINTRLAGAAGVPCRIASAGSD
jgi:hypothetical protein